MVGKFTVAFLVLGRPGFPCGKGSTGVSQEQLPLENTGRWFLSHGESPKPTGPKNQMIEIGSLLDALRVAPTKSINFHMEDKNGLAVGTPNCPTRPSFDHAIITSFV